MKNKISNAIGKYRTYVEESNYKRSKYYEAIEDAIREYKKLPKYVLLCYLYVVEWNTHLQDYGVHMRGEDLLTVIDKFGIDNVFFTAEDAKAEVARRRVNNA